MIGYCKKDAGKEHYEEFSKGVSEEDLHRATNEFNRHAASDLKSKIQLNLSNILEQSQRFTRAFIHNPRFITWDHVLLKMCQSGQFFLSATWITPFAGKGLDIGRADAVWKLAQRPEDFDIEDVHKIFFGIIKQVDTPSRISADQVHDVVESWARDGHDRLSAAAMEASTDSFAEQADFIPVVADALE